MAKKNVPELRFKGFEEEWEEKELRELGAITTGSTPPTIKNLYYSDIGIPWVTPTDIKDNITVNAEKKLSNAGEKISRVVPKDTILVTCIASIGKNTLLGTKGSFNQQINGLTPNLNVNCPYFLFTESLLWSMKMKKTACSGTMKIVNREEFSLLSTYTPQKDEQTKIGAFFQNLDSLIALRQRKHDKLLTLKKSMLEKMFPKEGSEVPEIRFKGFSGKWERKKIGDVLTEKKRPIELQDDKQYELVTVRRRNEGVVSRGLLKGKDILVKNYYEIRAGDYLISKRQIVHGANGLVPLELDRAIVSNEYLVIIENDTITCDFLTLVSRLSTMYRLFFLSSYGVDIEKLVFDVEDWKKRIITIPELAEQAKITTYFQRIDSLISLQARELDKLKNIKKACLEKMFV